MKLTPLDIQQQRFPKAALGYDKKEVEAFLEFIGRDVEAALFELGAQKERTARLEDELFRYREREETLKEALVTAQKMSEDMRVAAKKEAELIIADAEMKAERIIHSAHGRLLQILDEISDMKRQRIQLHSGLKQVLETHRKLLEATSDERAEHDSEVTYLRTKRAPQEVPVPDMPDVKLKTTL